MIDKELIHQAAEDIDIFQADLTEEYDQLMEARNKPRRRLRLWPLAAAACVAGIIAIFLAPPRTSEEQPPLALEEPTVSRQLSTVNCQLSTPKSHCWQRRRLREGLILKWRTHSLLWRLRFKTFVREGNV